MKALPYIFIVFAYFVGYFTHYTRHTCPVTYPTRNEMLIHLREYGYKGLLDNKIGTGGNDAWDNKDEAEWKEKANQYGIENMNQAGDMPE